MIDIEEILRLDAPAPRPQAIAFDGESLWLGSLETQRLYALDPHAWTVKEEMALGGKPWGATVVGDGLRLLLGVGEDDSRVIFQYVPGHGQRMDESIPCPDDTGSHLSYDGDRLFVSQWYNKRIVSIDALGAVGTTIPVTHQICGHTIVEGLFYCLTTDDESSNDYFLTTVDARAQQPVSVDIARVPFPGRGLAFDGTRFWTNHREANQTIAFTVPH